MNSTCRLIFDLDGTLSDPAVGIGRSINHALSAFGYPTIAAHEVVPFIGPPLDATFRQLVPGASPEHILQLVQAYRERYADVGYAENVLYEGMPEVLGQLAAHGPLALCTSKRRDFAVQILERFNLLHLFSVVSGGDIGITKNDQLRGLLGSNQIHPDAVMIGDRAVDIHAAHDNGLKAVGVLWGFGSADELSGAAPHRLFEAPQQLLELLPS
ncbi:MAG: HAD hydrolase-like protein [Rhizobacter sp.]|jgi:phosphoglycolate phosphatase